MDSKPKVSKSQKEFIAKQIIEQIETMVQLIWSHDVTTFDLSDIRKLVMEKCSEDEIREFRSAMDTLWKVWR